MSKDLNKNMTIKELEERGYVILAYHTDIVKDMYEIDDAFAFEVLEEAVTRSHQDILLSIETRLT